MEKYNQDFDTDRFFAQLAASEQSVLMLDYDGTLAPFREKRMSALPYPGIREKLESLIANPRTRLVIISGRTLEELNKLLGLKNPVELFACHGAIRQFPNGTSETYKLTDETTELLRQITAWGKTEGLKERIESKGVSVAFHWRGLPESSAESMKERIERKWSAIASESGLISLVFDGGIEFRPQGIDKGTAVRTILGETSANTPVAYLGDDLTDEDAFRELGDRGLKVLVRVETRPTLADFRLTPPGELLEFLYQWLSEEKLPASSENRTSTDS